MAFKTLHTVNYPSEAHVMKMQLEAEGVDVFLKDEFMAQVTGVPQEVGGVKVQVKEEDFDKAGNLLIKLGYVDLDAKNNSLLDSIDSFTQQIPIIKNWDFIVRLLIFVASVILIFLVVIVSLMPNFN